MSLLNSRALQLSVEALHTFSEDVEVVRGACGVVDVLAEAGVCVGVGVCVCCVNELVNECVNVFMQQ